MNLHLLQSLDAIGSKHIASLYLDEILKSHISSVQISPGTDVHLHESLQTNSQGHVTDKTLLNYLQGKKNYSILLEEGFCIGRTEVTLICFVLYAVVN